MNVVNGHEAVSPAGGRRKCSDIGPVGFENGNIVGIVERVGNSFAVCCRSQYFLKCSHDWVVRVVVDFRPSYYDARLVPGQRQPVIY